MFWKLVQATVIGSKMDEAWIKGTGQWTRIYVMEIGAGGVAHWSHLPSTHQTLGSVSSSQTSWNIHPKYFINISATLISCGCSSNSKAS